jgi:membrane protease YdiL (CAAX protease family)
MGFLRARLQDRHGPLKASLLVTVLFALWHLPDFFAQVGLATALMILAAAHLCARVGFLWLYNATGAFLLAAVALVAATRGPLAYEKKGP